MKFPLFSRVVLMQDIPEENLFAGDIGVTVEHYPATKYYPEGYEVEFFAATGETLNVVSLDTDQLRSVTGNDIFHVREKVYESILAEL